MQSVRQSKEKKIHSRKIEVSTYDYGEQRIIVEGVLKEERFHDSHLITGEKFPRGTIHHMVIRLLVNCSNLMIEDADVELITVPREICKETMDSLESIKGLLITKGFTLKVKKIAGGNKGCTHLVELLQAMAPAVLQGYAAKRAQNQVPLDSDQAKMILQFLINTCHAWHEDSPFVEKFKNMIK